MPTDTLISLALSVLLVCWAVGAHNRLVRLKNAVGKEYLHIDAQLRQRQDLLTPLLEMQETVDASLMSELSQASRAVRAAMEQARQRPSGGPEALALQRAEQRLDAKLAAFWTFVADHEASRAEPRLREAALELVQLEGRLDLVAEPYNRAVVAYNEAVHEFPALLIARLAGLKPLPSLQLGSHATAREAARPLLVGRRDSDSAPQTSAS